MNKRQLKRTVNSVCTDLFAECVAASLYSARSNEENAQALLASVVTIHNDFLRRISHPEPGLAAKLYYNQLSKDFNNAVSEVLDHIADFQ
jgi:hypothetical protein